jgi:hypothetical protein
MTRYLVIYEALYPRSSSSRMRHQSRWTHGWPGHPRPAMRL